MFGPKPGTPLPHKYGKTNLQKQKVLTGHLQGRDRERLFHFLDLKLDRDQFQDVFGFIG